MAQLQSGIVKWFDNEKGFGFIENENGPDIFLHYSKIEGDGFKSVKERERVYFELRMGSKGPYAANVKPTNIIMRQETEDSTKMTSVPLFVWGQTIDDSEEKAGMLAQMAEMVLAAHGL